MRSRSRSVRANMPSATVEGELRKLVLGGRRLEPTLNDCWGQADLRPLRLNMWADVTRRCTDLRLATFASVGLIRATTHVHADFAAVLPWPTIGSVGSNQKWCRQI